MNYGNSNGNNRLVRPPLFRETDVLLLVPGVRRPSSSLYI